MSEGGENFLTILMRDGTRFTSATTYDVMACGVVSFTGSGLFPGGGVVDYEAHVGTDITGAWPLDIYNHKFKALSVVATTKSGGLQGT